jgi:hypothetical protein
MENDDSELKLFEAEADLNTLVWEWDYPIISVADNGFLKTVKIFVLNGADVNKRLKSRLQL